MAEPRKDIVFVAVPLSARERKLIDKNIVPDPYYSEDPGRAKTISGISVWAIEQYHRASGNQRLVAKQFEVPVREVRAAVVWADIYREHVDAYIERNTRAAGWAGD